MSMHFSLLGLNTLELISIGSEKSAALAWSLMDHEGPSLRLFLLGAHKDKVVMMPKDLLETLYQRFAALNPKGTVIVLGQSYLSDYTPAGISKEEASRLEDEGKLFQDITSDADFYPRLREIMPELTQPDVLARLAADPEIDPALLRQAMMEGAVSNVYGARHFRWSLEWAGYVEVYRRAHPSPRA